MRRPAAAFVVVAALALSACSSSSTPGPTQTSGPAASSNPASSTDSTGSTGSTDSSDSSGSTGSTESGGGTPPVATVTAGAIDITGSGDGEVSFPVSGRFYLATLKTEGMSSSAIFRIKGRELPSIMGMGAQTTVFPVPEGATTVSFLVESVGGGYSLHLAAPPGVDTAQPAPYTISGTGAMVTPVVNLPDKVGVTFMNTSPKAGMSICVVVVYDAVSGSEVTQVSLSGGGDSDTQWAENAKGPVFAIVSCPDLWRLDLRTS